MKRFGKFGLIAMLIIFIAMIIMSSNLIETNKAGNFQVKQAWITGKITVRVKAGTYWQGFGKITTYKNVATIGFGREKGEGSADIESIDVIFNDGSKAKISGLVRVKLPNTEEGGKELIREYSEGFDHFIKAGILPVVRNAVKLSANLRSAQDAYTTLALFQQAVDDQVTNGTYVTKSAVIHIDRTSGKLIENPGKDDDVEEKKVTIVVNDEFGNPMRVPNRLAELNCVITQCVVDVPDFDPKVEEMISKRKDETMKTELSKQEAIRAKQDAITAMEQGKANVAKAKYEEEVIKEKAVVVAQREFEVAELKAKQANEEKKAVILAAQAKKQELLIADGLSELARYQIDANKEATIEVAKALSNWKGPQIVMAGGSDSKGGGGVQDALMIQMMQQIAKDMGGK